MKRDGQNRTDRPHNGAKRHRSAATTMMVVGALMIAVAVMVSLITAEPLPTGFGAVGLVFLAVGARRRRQASRR